MISYRRIVLICVGYIILSMHGMAITFNDKVDHIIDIPLALDGFKRHFTTRGVVIYEVVTL